MAVEWRGGDWPGHVAARIGFLTAEAAESSVGGFFWMITANIGVVVKEQRASSLAAAKSAALAEARRLLTEALEELGDG